MLQFVFALGVQGLLLEDQSSGGWLAAAALGENAGGALATLVLTIVAAATCPVVMHLLAHAASRNFGAALVLVTTMQVLLLPVLHGLFFADRVVRVIMSSRRAVCLRPRRPGRDCRQVEKIVLHCSRAVPPAGANW